MILLQYSGNQWFWCFLSMHNSEKLRAPPRCRMDQMGKFCPLYATSIGNYFKWRHCGPGMGEIDLLLSTNLCGFTEVISTNLSAAKTFRDFCVSLKYHSAVDCH